MAEIQRYEIGSASGTKERMAPYGPWVKHTDHLAELAAKDEERQSVLDQQGREMAGRHESELKFRGQIHGERIDANVEEHERRLALADAAWRDTLGQEQAKHATELAAQAEEHKRIVLEQRIQLDATRVNQINQIQAKHAKEMESNEKAWQTTYGRIKTEHAADLAALRGEGEPALIQFEHPRLIGEPCMIHRDFRPAVQMLGAIAEDCDVRLHITHSMRRLNQRLVGAIVREAERSNHHAGSAVDLNVVCDGAYYTSEHLTFEKILNLLDTHPVRRFILAAKDGPNCIRWGGSWGDAVHFDDNLVLRDAAEWERRVKDLQDD